MRASSLPPLDVDALLEQLGPSYALFPPEERALHVELLTRVARGDTHASHVSARGAGRCTLAVAARDTPGTLSMIAGSLTAARLDIEAAEIFTVQMATEVPRPPGQRRARAPVASRAALDIFQLHGDGGVTAETWDRWNDELTDLLRMLSADHPDEARAHLVDRVAEVLRETSQPEDRLWPVSVEVIQDSGDSALRVLGQDTRGFLFALANALTLLDVDITRAEIRTHTGESDDLFWITDMRGRPVGDPQRIAQLRAAVALIKQFTVLLPHAPDPAQALREFSALTRQLLANPDWPAAIDSLRSADVQRTLADLFGTSAFLWDDFLRMQYVNLFPLVRSPEALEDIPTTSALSARLRRALTAADDFEARERVLNAFKDREMFRIDLRHIRGHTDFRSFAEELTDLADVVVSAAAQLVIEKLGPAPCAWTICALGKFGGRELGFASDVELLFVYAEDDAPGTDAIARYFETFVRTFLDTFTTQREGIFEVDLRLRPHGNAGPLASSLSGLSTYYAVGGEARQFERLALVKLRTAAGDERLGSGVEAARDAFVYSGEPLDWGDIRHLRERQASELVPPGAVNAKYSAGGLVDIEYWVQARQIEAGARDRAVRAPSTSLAIERLSAGTYIGPAFADELAATYAFLRRLIDALRVVRGHARDLTVPPSESREFAYLARRLELEPVALAPAIDGHMRFAHALWDPGHSR
jgi:glutamate-ammonia-ligase adenylyltransferase